MDCVETVKIGALLTTTQGLVRSHMHKIKAMSRETATYIISAESTPLQHLRYQSGFIASLELLTKGEVGIQLVELFNRFL